MTQQNLLVIRFFGEIDREPLVRALKRELTAYFQVSRLFENSDIAIETASDDDPLDDLSVVNSDAATNKQIWFAGNRLDDLKKYYSRTNDPALLNQLDLVIMTMSVEIGEHEALKAVLTKRRASELIDAANNLLEELGVE